MSLRNELEINGFVVIRDVFTHSEISRLETQLLNHFESHWNVEGLGKHQPNAHDSVSNLKWLIFHNKLNNQNSIIIELNCDWKEIYKKTVERFIKQTFYLQFNIA